MNLRAKGYDGVRLRVKFGDRSLGGKSCGFNKSPVGIPDLQFHIHLYFDGLIKKTKINIPLTLRMR